MKPLFGGYVTLDRHEYIMVCDTWDEALKELYWIAKQCKPCEGMTIVVGRAVPYPGHINVDEVISNDIKRCQGEVDQGEEVYYLHDNMVTPSQKAELQDYLTDIYRAWINRYNLNEAAYQLTNITMYRYSELLQEWQEV